MVILGTLIIAFGWFALNCGRSIAAGDGQSGIIGMNTALASVAGVPGATIYMWSVYGKPDPSVMCNGLLGGLVASSAGCAVFLSLCSVFCRRRRRGAGRGRRTVSRTARH